MLSFSFLLSGVKGWLSGEVVAPQWARLKAMNQLQQRRRVSSLVKLTNRTLCTKLTSSEVLTQSE